MIMSHSSVRASVFGTLAGTSVLNPQGARHKKSIFSDLLLTALIDAFSILVIFLLMSFSSSGELLQLKGMELPKAEYGAQLERNTVIKLEENKIFVEDQEVSPDGLVAALMEIRTKFNETRPNEEFPGKLTIQADRRLKYQELNAIVLSSSNAGYSDIKFAVLAR